MYLPFWSWTYGSRIHNYLCNQYFWVRIPPMQGVLDSTLYYKVCQSAHMVQVNLHLILSQTKYVIAVFIFFFYSFFPDVGKIYSTDIMAKSLIESPIFVAFISNNYVNDPACCNLFKFAKTTLRKPFILVSVGPDHEWKKSALGLLVSDVVSICSC
jgi:hypothetical protein